MSRWTANFQNQQILQKIQDTLRLLQTAGVVPVEPVHVDEYKRALKVAKLLEVRFATLDPELFNQNTWGNFNNWMSSIQSQANAFVQNKNPGHLINLNNVLDEVLTVLRPIDLQFSEKEVQALAEASGIYQQKLIEELDKVKKQASQTKAEFQSLKTSISQNSTKLSEFGQTIEEGKKRIDKAISDYQTQFSAAQEKRTNDFASEIKKNVDVVTGQMEQFQDLFKESSEARARAHVKLFADLKESGDKHLSLLKTREEEVNKIFGAIGTAAFAGNFKKTADEEKGVANMLRWIALSLMTAMIVIAGMAFYYSIKNAPNWETFVFRFGTVLIFAVPAFYAANESSKHRERERHARKIHLELTAIDAYLVLLPEAQRNDIKGKLADKFFGVPEIQDKVETVSKKDLFSLVKMIVADLTKGK